MIKELEKGVSNIKSDVNVCYGKSIKYGIKTVNDLIWVVKNIKRPDLPIKTVFYKGKKLCNLNNKNYTKNLNKLSSLDGNLPVRIKSKRARRWVGDYWYYNTRMQFMVAYID